MQLFLMRHGIAEPRSDTRYPRDADRPLTEKGARKVERIARATKCIVPKFDLVLSSPYRRSRETAEIVTRILRRRRRLALSPNLRPGANPRELIAEIRKRVDTPDAILLVGHEPFLSALISLLVSGDSTLSLRMKKAGLCSLSVKSLHAGRCATLEWLAAPAQLFHVKASGRKTGQASGR